MLLYYLKILFISVVAGLLFVFSRYVIDKIIRRDIEYSVFRRLAFVISLAFIIFVAYSLENGKLEGIDKMFSAELNSPPNKEMNFFSLEPDDNSSLGEIIHGENVLKSDNADCEWNLNISTRAFNIDSQSTESHEYYVKLITKCNYSSNIKRFVVDSIKITYGEDTLSHWIHFDSTATSRWRNDMNVPGATIFQKIVIPKEVKKIYVSFLAYSDSTGTTVDDTLSFKLDLYKRSNMW